MRKWMRDRLDRRKKKPEETDKAAPPPLQPAYFDGEGTTAAHEPGSGADMPPSQEPVFESQPDSEESPALELAGEADALQALSPGKSPRPATSSSNARSRGRRRGGRGRGGRGREQAVAQAFAPATIKGSVSASPSGSEDAEIAGGEEPAANLTGEGERAAPVAQSQNAQAAGGSGRPPKGLVVLAIGLPGSGKSSWFKRHSVVPLSSDMVRSLLFDDVREQRFQDLVFSNLRSMLKARLIAKRPTNYVDATNLTPQERQHWIKLAKDYGYEVHAVFFDVPLEVCVERHQRRDRVVPEDVMRRMAAKLKPPAFEEGFAKITVVRVKKKEGAEAVPPQD